MNKSTSNSQLKIQLAKFKPALAKTLVVFAHKDKNKKPVSVKLDADLAKLLNSAHQEGVFGGDKKDHSFFRDANINGYQHVLFMGLGDGGSLPAENFRVAAATITQILKAHKSSSATIMLESATKGQKDAAAVVHWLTEGFLLSIYDYNEFKSSAKTDKSDKKKAEPTQFPAEIILATSGAPTAAMQKALEQSEIIAECQNMARRLGDTPANFMTPSILADEAVKCAKGTSMKVTVWDKARIKKERFGGLLSVSLGSDEEPRFIIMEYKGAAASKKPVCFVGKGLTFDTGGVSIKPSQSMEEMKYDMCGGAAVIATMAAIARLKLKINAIGLVPSTENMCSGSALKPGDVYEARNGKTVEVFNTDAEGRLILGDALAYASELKPAAIFDAATLTGAILVALGNTHTGVFTRDNKVWKTIQEAAAQSGEWVWQMPLVDFHTDDMRGTHADLCNISSGRMAGSSTAAAFLAEFVDKEIPWAHFDIAGTAWNVHNRFAYHPKKSASGIMVRTFIELAQNY